MKTNYFCIVTLGFYPIPGGLTTRINGLIKLLIKHHIYVKIVSPLFCGEISSIDDINQLHYNTGNLRIKMARIGGFYRIFTFIPLSLFCFLEIIKASNDRKIILQFEDAISFIPTFFAKIFLKTTTIGDDMPFRNETFKFPFSIIVKAYEIFVIKSADIMATSFVADYEIMKRMRKEKKTLFVANGVEVNQNIYIDYRKKSWKRIIFVSGFSRFSRLINPLLEIGDSLSRIFTDIQIWVIGSGYEVTSTLLNSSAVTKGVVKLLGTVSFEKLQDLYEEAAIGILPFFGGISYSSQRTKTLEYFAHGLLVVSSKEDLCGFRGLQSGYNCLIVESTQEMITALQQVLYNPEKFVEISKRGRQFIIEKYQWDKVAEDYLELITNLVV